MSGAEALAVVGIIANVIQLAEFSTKVISRIRDFSKDTKDVPQAFLNLKVELPLLCHTLQRTSAKVSSGQLDTKTCEAIKPLITAFEERLTELREILDQVTPKEEDSKIDVVWKAVRSIRKDRDVERISASITSSVQKLTLFYSESAGLQHEEREMLAEALSKIKLSSSLDAQNYNVPFSLGSAPVSGIFVGRQRDMETMKAVLSSEKAQKTRQFCIIYGLGGIGKTQLAVQFARENKARFSSVFWFDGKTEDSLIQSILQVASILPEQKQFDSETARFAELKARALEILEWFSRPGNSRWLLIYDNVDKTSYDAPDGDADSTSAYNLTDYLPDGDVGSVIVTTRLQRLCALGESLGLNRLNDDEALQVLEKRSRKNLKGSSGQASTRLNSQQTSISQELSQLIQKLDGLPLALVLAGTYIRRTNVATYLRLYDNSWRELHKSLALPDYPSRTIITTWMVTYDHVSQVSESAEYLLRTWGFLDSKDIWYELFGWGRWQNSKPPWMKETAASEVAFLRIIDILLEHSLIEQSEDETGCLMHTVVHDWIKSWEATPNDYVLYFLYALVSVGSCVPTHDTQSFWVSQRRLMPHANRLLHQMDSFDLYTSPLVPGLIGPIFETSMRIGELYMGQAQFSEAERVFRYTLSGMERYFGQNHGITLGVTAALGRANFEQGRFPEAETKLRQAYEGHIAELGEDHMLTLSIANHLGMLYGAQGYTRKALELCERAHNSYKRTLGSNDKTTLQSANDLGLLYASVRDFTRAEIMYTESIEGCKETFGLSHPLTLQSINNLGLLRLRQDNLLEAESMCQQAFRGMEASFGHDHPMTRTGAGNLGEIYFRQGRLVEAEEMYQRALTTEEQTGAASASNSRSTAHALFNYGLLCMETRRFSDAKNYFERARNRFQALFGEDNPSTISAQAGLNRAIEAMHQDQDSSNHIIAG